MNCRKVKELIYTDFLDNELNEKLKAKIEEHLAVCSQCRELEKSLRKLAVRPFKNLQEMKPADSVWGRIREGIEEEQISSRESVPVPLKDYLRGFFNVRRPVFATLTGIAIVVIIAAISITSLTQEAQLNSYLQEQGEFLSSLGAENGSSGQIEVNTAIEELFL